MCKCFLKSNRPVTSPRGRYPLYWNVQLCHPHHPHFSFWKVYGTYEMGEHLVFRHHYFISSSRSHEWNLPDEKLVLTFNFILLLRSRKIYLMVRKSKLGLPLRDPLPASEEHYRCGGSCTLILRSPESQVRNDSLEGMAASSGRECDHQELCDVRAAVSLSSGLFFSCLWSCCSSPPPHARPTLPQRSAALTL